MSAAEKSVSSIDPVPSVEGSVSAKKDKDDDRKRRRAALRLIKNETYEDSEKPAESKKSPFRLNLNSEQSKKKDEGETHTEAEPKHDEAKIEDETEAFDAESPEEIERPEVPLEVFDDQEKLEAAQMISTERIEGLANEPENNETDESVHDALYDFYAKVVDEGKEPEVARDEVFVERGIDPATAVLEKDNDEDEDEAEEKLSANGHELDLSGEADEGEMPLEFVTNEVDDTQAVSPAANAGVAGASGGGSNRPPIGGNGGGRGNGGSNQPPRPNPFRSTRYAPNALPVAPATVQSKSYNHIRRDHQDYWSGFMTGGMLGYFVGHRRGRIKTEKKLGTVKKSLEKQIKKVDKEVKAHDKVIRKLVTEKALVAPIPRTHKERPLIVKKETFRNKAPVPKSMRKESLVPVAIPATEIHLGRLVMAETPKEAEVRERIRSEVKLRSPEASARTEKLVADKKVIRPETMSSSELLKESENIIIDGTSLRQIYESQLVGEKGLRRLVAEFMRGGDLKAALKREVVERQIDFERDPVMRDIASSGSTSSESGQRSLEQMIKRAESGLASSQEEVAFLKAKAAHEDKEKDQDSQHVKAINAMFLVIITILLGIIIFLGIVRHG